MKQEKIKQLKRFSKKVHFQKQFRLVLDRRLKPILINVLVNISYDQSKLQPWFEAWILDLEKKNTGVREYKHPRIFLKG